MSPNKIIKPILIAASLTLAACSSENTCSDCNANTPIEITGTVSAASLVGATICIDDNKNLFCDLSEPASTVEDNLTFKLPAPASNGLFILYTENTSASTSPTIQLTAFEYSSVSQSQLQVNLSAVSTFSTLVYLDQLEQGLVDFEGEINNWFSIYLGESIAIQESILTSFFDLTTLLIQKANPELQFSDIQLIDVFKQVIDSNLNSFLGFDRLNKINVGGLKNVNPIDIKTANTFLSKMLPVLTMQLTNDNNSDVQLINNYFYNQFISTVLLDADIFSDSFNDLLAQCAAKPCGIETSNLIPTYDTEHSTLLSWQPVESATQYQIVIYEISENDGRSIANVIMSDAPMIILPQITSESVLIITPLGNSLISPSPVFDLNLTPAQCFKSVI